MGILVRILTELKLSGIVLKKTNTIKQGDKVMSGLLIFRAVADPRNSGISAKSREIPQKTRNTVKSARNISDYMSAKHI